MLEFASLHRRTMSRIKTNHDSAAGLVVGVAL